MLALININRMVPPIAPLGLEYTASAAARAGIDVDIVDTALADSPEHILTDYFANHCPELVGISFRNVDDCFWPACNSFVGELAESVTRIKQLTDAPVLLGGVGYSLFPERLLEYSRADFGIYGDGEVSVADLLKQLRTDRQFHKVPGLLWQTGDSIRANPPHHCDSFDAAPRRDILDNRTYFERGGQCGIETKRGCNRSCLYCPEPVIKGRHIRIRHPEEVCDEIESLLEIGVDVLHTCDSEFNIPYSHAAAVCERIIERSLGEKVRWYAYMAVTPFDARLAQLMRRAGCRGINFTSDSGCEKMLQVYRQKHGREDLANVVKLCRQNDIAVMFDLLIGGPGETPETAAESIDYIKRIGPDCVGVPLGIRIYPGTPIIDLLAKTRDIDSNPNVRRKYDGRVDLLEPTFFISEGLGDAPAELICDLIGEDERFFKPSIENQTLTDHNYNENTALVDAIAAGARGAYWDILRQI